MSDEEIFKKLKPWARLFAWPLILVVTAAAYRCLFTDVAAADKPTLAFELLGGIVLLPFFFHWGGFRFTRRPPTP
jgi:hypothetical protein